ncbi:hypothetical protein D0T23_11365 [Duganella sp. BJB475]|nr:hypothetical protein D0T23_11365 [Duganella sp. BJB475]RFP30948.1 hypothetical protein D0T21_13745 [Duganella sp. BJB476]
MLSEHDGYVTRARLERELGVPMAHATEVAPGYMQYLLERDTDWYMTVALVEYGAHSFVDFKWYPENFPGPAPQCVDVDTARQRILQLGWTLGFSDRHISVFDQFSKNGNSLHLYFGGKCVHALRFGGVNRDPAS